MQKLDAKIESIQCFLQDQGMNALLIFNLRSSNLILGVLGTPLSILPRKKQLIWLCNYKLPHPGYLWSKLTPHNRLSQKWTLSTEASLDDPPLSIYFVLNYIQPFKVGFKFNIQKTKIMASSPITSWEIDAETAETVADFIYCFGLPNHCRWSLQPWN